jgi:hypothetical protein
LILTFFCLPKAENLTLMKVYFRPDNYSKVQISNIIFFACSISWSIKIIVSSVYCKNDKPSRCCICCNGCTRILQASIFNVLFIFSDVYCKCVYLDVTCVCFCKCFRCRLFQVFHLSSDVCCKYCIWMF